MIHRHPHVFGNVQVESAEEVASNWARIKQTEKGTSEDSVSSLREIPSGSPALLRAHRMGERAAKIGFDWANVRGGLEKGRGRDERSEDRHG